MTAIYSYASPNDEIGFVGADNINLENSQKVDKITLVGGRYAIGTYGKGVVTQALDTIASFEMFENVTSPHTLEEILAEAWKITRILCEQHYNTWEDRKKNNEIKEIEWVEFLNSSTTLVILDCQEFELYEVKQPYLFPPDKIQMTTEISKMATNILHLSSFASIAARRDHEKVTFNNRKEILSFLEDRILKDQKVVDKIGDLGAVIIAHRDGVTCRTSFTGAIDYISGIIPSHLQESDA